MTVARPPQPSGDNFKTWGIRLNEYLVRTRSQLAQFTNTSSAINDGMLVWDADNSRVLYSNDGVWIPLAGTTDNFASLYHEGSAKITATADGVTAFGNITLSGFPESDYELKGDIDGAVRFHAIATEALSKGDVVYIVEHASSGSETKVAKALASDAAKMPAFGLALDNAAIDAAVQVVTFGNLYGSGGAGNALDTSAYNSGTPLYVSATTAGEWTGTAPTGESNLVQNIGKVVRKQQTNGVIKVGGAGRTNATPNLNDGNIFIGNSSNEAVTASLATQVSALETSHDDVLVDGDFASAGFMKTDGAGNYSIDSSTYLTDITTQTDPKYLRADADDTTTGTITAPNVDISTTGSVTTNIASGSGSVGHTKVLNLGTGYGFGGTTTVNIGSSTPYSVNTINLNGNVSLGGTFNGHPEEMVRGIDVYHYYDDLSHQSGGNYYLNNTLTEYGNPFQFKTYTNGATRQLKISIEVSYFDVNSTNDCQIGLRVSPSSASAVSMGSVISVTSPATYTRDIEVSGDHTKYLSKISAIANTSNGVQTLPIYKYYYNVFTSRTIIRVGVFGISAANIPSAGDTLYVHPFGWDASAQDIVRSIDAYNALGVVNNTVEQTFFLGTYTVRNSIRLIARETTTSENVSIDNVYGIFTDTGA